MDDLFLVYDDTKTHTEESKFNELEENQIYFRRINKSRNWFLI
jgi:hypothetical protein